MKIKKGFVKRKIGDKYLVITTGELSKKCNKFIELNSTSSMIWDLIEEGKNPDEIAISLTKTFNVDYNKAKEDTDKIIHLMNSEGILE